MSDQESIRKIFEDFVLADEVDQVSTSFSEILSLAEVNPDDIIDLKTQLFEQIANAFEHEVKFRHQKLFEVIREALAKRGSFRQAGAGDHKVFLSGAGPCGLRTAVECALLGFQVTLVEKRKVFSRANILTLWTQTKSDLVALGAKFFYPEMKTQGFPLHLGTREMQLCLLKISLLLGVDVRYETELVGFNYDTSQKSWVAQVKPSTKKKEKVAPAGLDFKPLKTGDYQKTYVCNMVDKVELDEEFIQTDLKGANGATTIPFNACVVAEGEWSQTCRKLGFEKTIDKFNQALGIVINMEFNRDNKQENKLKSFTSSLMYNSKRIGGGHLDNLKAAGIICENLEYLKGTTHYFALTVKKESLLEAGIFKEDKTTSDLLTDDNLDYDALETLAKKIAVICGLPEETKFYKVNPVQIFDFSTRARARLPMQFLKANKSDGGQVSVVSSLPKSEDETDKFAMAPVYPVGDALLEPFWPQGLGSNRGFHTCLDSSHSILLLHTRGPKAAFDERIFSHCTMLETPWGMGPMALNKFQYWSTDPLTRYSPDTLKNGYKLVKRKKKQLPQRFESPQVFKTVENILSKIDSGVPSSKATFDADESGCVIPLLDY